MHPCAALAALGGASRWKAIVEAGVTDGDLQAAVRRGQIVRQGAVYALPGAPADFVLAANLSGRLTCGSAAQAMGVDVLVAPDRPHVAVSRSSREGGDAAVLHRVGRGRGVVVPLRGAALQALRCLPAIQALVIVDCALRRGLLTTGLLREALVGPGSVRARGVLALADPKSGSMIETIVRVALRTAGLPVVSQVWIRNVGRVDFVIGGWLVVEIESHVFRSR
jgi:hypothetical protein